MTGIDRKNSDLAPPLNAAPSGGSPSARKCRVLVVGLFPPPIDGQRLVTLRMHDALEKGADVARVELDLFPRLRGISKVLSLGAALCACALGRARGYRDLYLAPHSGGGLVYSSVLAGASRLLGFRLYVHYHSFKNMGRRARLMAAFVRLCGAEALHIVLGPSMAVGLKAHYPEARNIFILSNATFLPERPALERCPTTRLRIGHLSNLSRAKGLDSVIDCMRRLLAAGVDAELVLAGPATNGAARALLDEARSDLAGRLVWLGPVDPEEIDRFYKRIDIFLFPTIYEHEAEPLVVIEALSFGVPVLATERGCIAGVLDGSGGYAFGGDFVSAAVQRIRAWAESRGSLAEASARARERFAELRVQYAHELERLLARIGAGPALAGSRPVEPARTLAYFGPDRNDAAFRRRLAQWRYAGFSVQAFAFSRPTRTSGEPDCVELGHIEPHSRGRRVLSLIAAAARLIRARRRLAGVRLIVARNLDNLLLALLSKLLAPLHPPVVYEVLDINRSLTTPGFLGRCYRTIDRMLIGCSDLLVVSSPHFITKYFQNRLGYSGKWYLFENKVPRYARCLMMPHSAQTDRARSHGPPVGRRWRIGWFGYLDDERSWRCLRRLARALPDKVEIRIRGVPYGDFDAERFLADLQNLPNVAFGGSYRNPEDLSSMYGEVDIIWAVDCNDLAGNSRWLLPNSVYEAAYFGVPSIALDGSGVGEYVSTRGIGWCISEPLEESLVALIDRLGAGEHRRVSARLRELGSEPFMETDEISEIWALAQEEAAARSVRPARRKGKLGAA